MHVEAEEEVADDPNDLDDGDILRLALLSLSKMDKYFGDDNQKSTQRYKYRPTLNTLTILLDLLGMARITPSPIAALTLTWYLKRDGPF